MHNGALGKKLSGVEWSGVVESWSGVVEWSLYYNNTGSLRTKQFLLHTISPLHCRFGFVYTVPRMKQETKEVHAIKN